jgi:hypothetical protein
MVRFFAEIQKKLRFLDPNRMSVFTIYRSRAFPLHQASRVLTGTSSSLVSAKLLLEETKRMTHQLNNWYTI